MVAGDNYKYICSEEGQCKRQVPGLTVGTLAVLRALLLCTTVAADFHHWCMAMEVGVGSQAGMYRCTAKGISCW